MLPGAPEHGRSWNLAFIGAKVSFEAKIKKDLMADRGLCPDTKTLPKSPESCLPLITPKKSHPWPESPLRLQCLVCA